MSFAFPLQIYNVSFIHCHLNGKNTTVHPKIGFPLMIFPCFTINNRDETLFHRISEFGGRGTLLSECCLSHSFKVRKFFRRYGYLAVNALWSLRFYLKRRMKPAVFLSLEKHEKSRQKLVGEK